MTESEDDEAFLKRAKQTAKDVVKNQTLEVDTVSGVNFHTSVPQDAPTDEYRDSSF